MFYDYQPFILPGIKKGCTAYMPGITENRQNLKNGGGKVIRNKESMDYEYRNGF